MNHKNIGPHENNLGAALVTFTFGFLYILIGIFLDSGSEEQIVFYVIGIFLFFLGVYFVNYKPIK